MAKVNVGVKIDPTVKLKLRYIAKQSNSDYPNFTRTSLTNIVNSYEKKHGVIDATLINQMKMEGF